MFHFIRYQSEIFPGLPSDQEIVPVVAQRPVPHANIELVQRKSQNNAIKEHDTKEKLMIFYKRK